MTDVQLFWLIAAAIAGTVGLIYTGLYNKVQRYLNVLTPTEN